MTRRAMKFSIVFVLYAGSFPLLSAKFRIGETLVSFSMLGKYVVKGIAPCPANKSEICYSLSGSKGLETIDALSVDASAVTAAEFGALKLPVGQGSIVFNHVHQQLHIYEEVSIRPCGIGPSQKKTDLPWPCARELTSGGRDLLISGFYDFVAKKMIDDHFELLNADNYHTLVGTTSFSATADAVFGLWQIGNSERQRLCFLILLPNGTFIANGGLASAPFVRGVYAITDGRIAFTKVEAWLETKGRKDGRFKAQPDIVLTITEVAPSKLEFTTENESGTKYIFVPYRPQP